MKTVLIIVTGLAFIGVLVTIIIWLLRARSLKREPSSSDTSRKGLLKWILPILAFPVGILLSHSFGFSWVPSLVLGFSMSGAVGVVNWFWLGSKPPYVRFRGKTLKEEVSRKAGPAWIIFWTCAWFLIYAHSPEFAWRLLWGGGSYTMGWWVMIVGLYLVNLGTFASAGGTGGYKLPRYLTIGLLAFMMVSFLGEILPPLGRSLPYRYKFGEGDYERAGYGVPANYESSVGSPQPGHYVVFVTPEGRNPDGSLKRLKVADVPKGTKTIKVTNVRGRVHVDGRITRIEQGTISADVRVGEKWKSVPLQLKDSPVLLILGDKEVWRIWSAGEIPVDVEKDMPLYAAILSERFGGGIVEIDIEL